MTTSEAVRRPEASVREPRVFHAQVLRVRQITPHFRRITLGGGQLDEFEPAGPDQFVYVFFPRPGIAGAPVPLDFTWESWRDQAEEERAVGRYYTVRAHRPDVAEIDLDFVIHGDGPGTTFGATARAGDWVAIWGPRIAYNPPPETGWLLLAADETGLPATAAILESLPAGMPAQVFLEVPGPADEQELPSAGDVRVAWLHRGDLPAGTNCLLLDAVRDARFLDDPLYAWVAGEVAVVRGLREHLQKERGLRPEAVCAVGYWRHREHEWLED